MIRRENIPTIRTLLLTCMLGITLSACANDGRLDLKKLDFSRLKQPDWLRWDKDDEASKTSPQSIATQADTAAKPTRAQAPATAIRTTANDLPRPKPSRPTAAYAGIPKATYRQTQTPEIKEQPAKAPQGKVTSEIPQALAALPPPDKAPRTGGKGSYTTNDLVGLDAPSVERLLGKPDLSRKEPFAEVWQYAHGDCVLFLFIYAEAGGTGRVSHAETGARDGGKDPDPGLCIGAILTRNAATPG